jgi:hypothetical protein
MVQQTVMDYPDLLGYVTEDQRLNIGVIQTALAVRPEIVRAGRFCEVILFVQNVSDAPVDVTVILTLPERDNKKQKERFVAKVNRLVIGVQPAEVGFVRLPVSIMPDTASGEYKFSVEVNAKALEKGNRIRPAEPVPLVKRQIHPRLLEKLDKLRSLTFTGEKRSLIKNVLEISLPLLAGKPEAQVDLKPGWVSLWSMLDLKSDPLYLIKRYQKEMLEQVLPNIVRMRTYQPLYDETVKRFESAAYPLKPLEASLIARSMALILEYATIQERVFDSPLATPPEEYQIKPVINRLSDEYAVENEEPVVLPQWSVAMLRAIAQDKRAAQFPERAVVRFAYDELLRDTIKRGFYLIEAATGEDLGSDEDKENYANQVLEKLAGKSQMDFTYAYLPLVMSGMVIYDSMLVSGEKLQDIMNQMSEILYYRRSEINDDNRPVFLMAKELLEQALLKFGLKVKI